MQEWRRVCLRVIESYQASLTLYYPNTDLHMLSNRYRTLFIIRAKCFHDTHTHTHTHKCVCVCVCVCVLYVCVGNSRLFKF